MVVEYQRDSGVVFKVAPQA